MGTVPETLKAFGETTLVVRAVGAVLASFPGAPVLNPYRTVDDVLSAVAPGATEAQRAAARGFAEDPVAARILAVGTAIDGADRQLARRSPMGATPGGFEPQASDAVLKALGLAWFANAIGTGDAEARVETFRGSLAGRALLAIWAAVDVALPLGGADVVRMIALHPDETTRWVAIAGEDAMNGVGPVSKALAPTLQKVVDTASKRTDLLATALAPFVPGLIPSDGSGGPPPGAVEQIALQSDRMPIYKWLAARLAAEHAVARAIG